MEQSVVEWLIKELDVDNNPYNMKIINQAREKFKQQIIESDETSHISMMTAEQYYKERYQIEYPANTKITGDNEVKKQ
jgi:hypothetical protein